MVYKVNIDCFCHISTYDGATPTLLVYDGNWLREALSSNFSKLMNRRPLFMGGSIDYGLFSIEGEHWKHVRSILSHNFAQGKLKAVSIYIFNIYIPLLSISVCYLYPYLCRSIYHPFATHMLVGS